jgi:transcription elongation factor Elf1
MDSEEATQDGIRNDGDKAGEDVPPCPLCGGSGVVLGKLENFLHIKCKNCGWVYGWMAKESTEVLEEIAEAIAKGEQRAER